MKEHLKLTMAVAALGLAIGIAPATANAGPKPAPKARISMARAKQIALKAQPGRITDGELEREVGGSGLRYSFDIRSGKLAHEVGVDAKTGKVLENSIEGPNAD